MAEGVDTSFIARRDDTTVEGYDWGGLTSGSSQQPFWVLLLPFTVLNVAGWMHPPRDRFPGQIRLIWGIVTALGITRTASVTLWVGVVLVDLLGYQWTRRLTGVRALRDFKLGSWSLVSGDAIQPLQIIGTTIGAVLTSLVMWSFFRLSANTQKEFEHVRPAGSVRSPPGGGRGRWAADEDLSSIGFFDHAPAARRLLDRHRFLMLVAGV